MDTSQKPHIRSRIGPWILLLAALSGLAFWLYAYFKPDPPKISLPVAEGDHLTLVSDMWIQKEAAAIARYDAAGHPIGGWDTDLNQPMVCFGDQVYVAGSRGQITAYDYEGKVRASIETDIPINTVQYAKDRLYVLGGTGIFVYDSKLQALEDYDTEARVAFVVPLEEGFGAVEVGTRGKDLRSSFSIYQDGRVSFRMTHFNEVVQYAGNLGKDRVFYVTDKAIYIYKDLVLDGTLEIQAPSAISHTDREIAIICGNMLRTYDAQLESEERSLRQAYTAMVSKDNHFYFAGPEGYGKLQGGKVAEATSPGLVGLKVFKDRVYLIYEDGLLAFPRRIS